jgi:phage terminase large subunit
MDIQLPNAWTPRSYQEPLWRHLHGGGKRAYCVWSRRSGKDDTALHWTACAMFERVGTYWHMLPEAEHARKAIWEAINPHTGKRRIDEAFPKELRETTRNNEMFIRFKNGSSWQLVGSDNYDTLVGPSPIGIVYSEWALGNPQAWGYLRVALAENNGWAVFITTPRGKNHAHTMLEYAKKSEGWFTQILTVDDTGHIDKDILANELKEMQSMYGPDAGRALFRQEYYCNFEASVVGSYYGDLMEEAAKKRIGPVPPTPMAPTVTGWDIGIGDSTAIWFMQMIGREPRLIDYYETNGKGLDHYVKVIKDKDYNYSRHYLPHDAGHKSNQTGKSYDEQMVEMGMPKSLITVLARSDVDAGIQQVRQLLPVAWFDKERCTRGIECLTSYRRKWDERNKVYSTAPLHDFASHGADAMRYLAVGIAEGQGKVVKPKEPNYFAQLGANPTSWMG